MKWTNSYLFLKSRAWNETKCAIWQNAKSILQVPSGNQIEHSFDANIHGLIHPSVRSYKQL